MLLTLGRYRKIRSSNPNFVGKVYSCKGAPEVFQLCGFKDMLEEGFLILPDGAPLEPLQKALELIAGHVVSRAEADEKKRKLDQEKATKARDARVQKAAAEAAPGQYDEAVSKIAHQDAMADEDESMVSAIEEFMSEHPELKGGRAYDAYSIDRQCAGPGASVVASVSASAGLAYFDYTAHMKRTPGGDWTVTKMEAA